MEQNKNGQEDGEPMFLLVGQDQGLELGQDFFTKRSK